MAKPKPRKVGPRTKQEIQAAMAVQQQKRRKATINRLAAQCLCTSGPSGSSVRKKIAARKQQAVKRAAGRSRASGGAGLSSAAANVAAQRKRT